MVSLILAAGYGTRLYPLSLDKPKPLFEVGDRCIIDYIIEKIEVLSPKKIFVVCNNKFYGRFVSWKKKRGNNISIVNDMTSTHEERLGAVGDIYYFLQEVNIDDDLLIIGGIIFLTGDWVVL